MRRIPHIFRRFGSSNAHVDNVAQSQHLLYQVWGANTDVGKTILSAGLLRAVGELALYLKPVQTGPPDHELVQNIAKHARTSTLVSLDVPLSPDLAAELSGIDAVEDIDVEHKILSTICRFEQLLLSKKLMGPAFGVVETAGGVLSPMPSGNTQADFYRKFRLPSVLVGDARLGGISTTLASYEALRLRGYDVPTIVVFPQHGSVMENEISIERGVDMHSTTVLRAPDLPPSDVKLSEYFESDEAASFFSNLWSHVRVVQSNYVEKVRNMQRLAPEILWYPFTQHQNLSNILCIDSAYADKYRVYDNQRKAFADVSDSFCSWWTTGVGHGEPIIAKAIAHAAGRYGHVGLPGMAHEGAFELAKQLLETVGSGWANRVFYSDNGSTAVEVGLKMALRKRNVDRPDKKHLEQQIIGLEGCYHGDTLGAMDCAAASDFNSKQTSWYKPRGLFFDAPTVAIIDGVWTLQNVPDQVQIGTTRPFINRDQIYDIKRDGKEYYNYIQHTIDAYLAANQNVDLAALLLEPIMLGAGGMRLIDPAFQRALVDVAKRLQMPVIFDEVFSGLWRLGVESGASLLGRTPDIACYAKTLTGGALPLAVTLSSGAVYDAFLGDTARDALLHGHSYTAHPAGCAAALAALQLYAPLAHSSRTYFEDSMCKELSCADGVVSVSTIGTVLAVELQGRTSGYAATGAMAYTKRLLERGILTRPLGNVLYIMVPPLVNELECRAVADTLFRVILDGSTEQVDETA